MEEENIKHEKTYKKIMLIALTSFITFIITSFVIYTYLINNLEELTTDVGSSSTTAYLKKIRKAINKYYLWNDQINEEDLEEGAIQGYVAGLGDKYTEYVPAEELEEYTENITGSFVGIGIYMIADEKSDRIIVYYPIPESPAEKVRN